MSKAASGSSSGNATLSSVVSNLVRAQFGASDPGMAHVADNDLDAYVAEMLLKEAKEKELKWSKEGVRAYFSDEEADGPAHKPNKRFLNSIIKNVDDHNQALLRKQATESPPPSTSAPTPRTRKEPNTARLFSLAKSNMTTATNSKEGKAKIEKGKEKAKLVIERLQQQQQPSAPTATSSRSERSVSPVQSLTDERKEELASRRYAERSESEAEERHTSSRRRSRRYSDDDEEESSSRRRHEHRSSREDERHRSSTHRSSRRREEGGSNRKRDEESSSRRDRDEESRSTRRHRSSRRSDSRDRDGRDRDDSDKHRSSQKDRSRSPTSKRSRRSHREERSRSPIASTSREDPEESKPVSRPQLTNGLARVLPPSRSPTPPSQSKIDPVSHSTSTAKEASKMDKYFSASYDPRLDVSVNDLTDASTGLIGEGNFDQWSQMIEILKIRKEEKNFRAAEREEAKREEKDKKRREKEDKKFARKLAKSKKRGRASDEDDSEEEEVGPKLPGKTAGMDTYAASTGAALLTIGGYAKKKSKTEWGAGPDLSF